MWTIDSNLIEKPRKRELGLAVLLDKFIQDNRPGGTGFPLIGTIAVDLWCYWGINPYYIIAHAIQETGFGTSKIYRDKNNLFGWNAQDKNPYGLSSYFDSPFGCVAIIMRKISILYLSPGGKHYLEKYGATLRGMNTEEGDKKSYASDPEWGIKICAWMNKIQSFVDEKRKPKEV